MSQGGAGVRRDREWAQRELARRQREATLSPVVEVHLKPLRECPPHGPFYEVKKRGWYGKLIQLHCRRCGQPVER